MNYEQAIIEFLARPENFPIALDVAKQVEHVKDHLQVQFWSHYSEAIGRRLTSAGLIEGWREKIQCNENLLGAYTKCRIAFKPQKPDVVHLDVALEAGVPRDGYPIYYGLHWSRPYQKTYESPTLSKIRDIVSKLGFRLNPNPWWVMTSQLRLSLRDDRLLTRLASEPAQVNDEVVNAVWTFFEQVRVPLEAVNEVLANSNIRGEEHQSMEVPSPSSVPPPDGPSTPDILSPP